MNNKIVNKSVTEIIDSDYRVYAEYVIENRAIPSCIDGFKPVQRKLFYAMNNKFHGKRVKIVDLGSISEFNYHHGEVSAQAAAVKMAQDWKNNIPVFIGHGNFGTTLVQEAAAPRYIFASGNPLIRKIFIDENVVDPHHDIDYPEPQCYLPLIPWVLVNGSSGMAVGHATNIVQRDPKELAKACKKYLETSKVPLSIRVSFPDFKGEVKEVQPDKFTIHGIVTHLKRNLFEVSELPFGYDREKYFNLLTKMEDESLIEDFDDLCDDSGFKFQIKLNLEQKSKAEKDLEKYFKLISSETENYTTLDEKGKLKIFPDVGSIVKYFCDYRLKKTVDFLDYEKKILTTDLEYFQAKKKFISSIIIKKDIDISKTTRANLEVFVLDNITKNKDFASKLIRMPIYEMTQDEINSLDVKISELKASIIVVENTDASKLFIERLDKLMKDL